MTVRMLGRAFLCVAAWLLPPTAAADAVPADAVMGEPLRTLLVAERDRTVVQVTFPVLNAPGDWASVDRIEWRGLVTEVHRPDTGLPEPVTPAYGFHVAVGQRAIPTWRVASIQWYRQPRDPSSPAAAVLAPQTFRGVSLAPAEVFPESGGGILAGLILEFQHPPPDDLGKSLDDAVNLRRAAAESAPGSLANPRHFRDLRAWSMARPPRQEAQRSVHPFGLTSNWVRLEVHHTGIYAVTGRQLEQVGVDLAGVDPTKMRLFKGGGLALDPDPTLAEGEHLQRAGLSEIAIDVQSGENEFDAADRLLFYGFGTDVWLDRLVPDAGPLDHYTHPFQNTGVYWLTWEALADPSPFAEPVARIGPPLAVPPGGAEPIMTHRARHHGEQNNVYLGGLVRDNWVWASRINQVMNVPLVLESAVVPGEQAAWQVDISGTRIDSAAAQNQQIVTIIRINNDAAGEVTRSWSMMEDQAGQDQMRISGITTALRGGSNTIRLQNDNFQVTGSFFALDSFDLLYAATLDKNSYPAALTSVFWGDEVPPEGALDDVRFTLPGAGQMRLWDVTQPQAVFELAGAEDSGPPRTLTISLQREQGQSRHLILFGEDDLLAVAAASAPEVRNLRGDLAPVDYVVVHPAVFTTAAERLVQMRSRTIPGIESPESAAVSVEDIYANFSGGQKDWRAIRQFLRWHFYDLPGGQRLRWVCLLGNASRDYRNYRNANPASDLFDWVPTHIETGFPSLFLWTSLTHPHSTDGSLVALDAPPGPPGIPIDMPDLAVGRLPANTPAQALAMVDRTIAHVEQLPAGPWRNRVTFCADDLSGSYPPATERSHMDQAERLAANFLPRFLDVDKIYLDAYPFEGNTKPAAQRALLSSLDAGTTLFYYVGHGGSSQLADEQVFRSDFIPALGNRDKRFVFMAFSCDVGVFDDPGSRSMAELFLMPDQVGAVASIAASWISYISHNNAFSNQFFAALYPADPNPRVDPAVTLGWALTDGKIGIWTSAARVRNALRYNLFGDPALRLANPVDDLEFAADSADSLLSGRLHHVRVDLSGAGSMVPSGADYQLLVQENSYAVPYSPPDWNDTWTRPGNAVFRGSGTLQAEADIPFLAPLSLRTGDRGRIRLLVDDGDHGRSAFLQVPVLQTAADASHDVDGPRIHLSFAGGRLRVQTGAELTASLFDTSGINILATNPANSVLMEFDGSGIYLNVSDAVVFDPVSYTRARLSTALPQDLELGAHQVVMTASDMFGNVGSDTLRFTLEAAGVAVLRDAAVFPNPSGGPCRLVCDLTAPMDLRWDIYTVSGRRVRSIVPGRTFPAGPAIIEWDGRDEMGDAIANGAYLYVLRGTMPGSDREIRETGQLVIMR